MKWKLNANITISKRDIISTLSFVDCGYNILRLNVSTLYMIFSINIKNNKKQNKAKPKVRSQTYFITRWIFNNSWNNRFYKITKHFQINSSKTEITNYYHQSNYHCILTTTIPMIALQIKVFYLAKCFVFLIHMAMLEGVYLLLFLLLLLLLCFPIFCFLFLCACLVHHLLMKVIYR